MREESEKLTENKYFFEFDAWPFECKVFQKEDGSSLDKYNWHRSLILFKCLTIPCGIPNGGIPGGIPNVGIIAPNGPAGGMAGVGLKIGEHFCVYEFIANKGLMMLWAKMPSRRARRRGDRWALKHKWIWTIIAADSGHEEGTNNALLSHALSHQTAISMMCLAPRSHFTSSVRRGVESSGFRFRLELRP